ncbi:MAG: NfeD-like protein [Firmicutes bacterium]|nr:NfeD-like protein [Bacillota bacterium]MBR1989874.1 NfeD-like protein [Bacillota bacterium]MBR6585618.1 NfeD-like protein [Bacillota bacterium]
MAAWWDSLDTLMRVLYCITIPATLVMVIQTVLSIFGGFESGAGVDFTDTSAFGGDMDLDFDGGSDIGELADGDLGGNRDLLIDGGNPADFSIASMFSVQGVVTFLMVMGWISIVSINSGANPLTALLIGCGLGLLTMYLVARLMFASRRLAENGTVDIHNAIGESGTVYIPVPPKGKGEGKINLYLQGRYVEVSCISNEDEMIPTGTEVRVTDARNGLLIVERDV